jgi:FMN phosphatase YigB (HAD superfamily)
MIGTVVFDVGETLVDETRHWGEWADWLGIPRLTFFAVLGAAIADGEHHRAVFEHLRPGLDLDTETLRREAGGWSYRFEPADFYADALPCLRNLRANGYKIGIAGNQPAQAEAALRDAGVSADFIASSESWGVEKPSPAFFIQVAEVAGRPIREIAYVGDRLDNDILPARKVSMAAIFIRRGPWGFIGVGRQEGHRASAIIESLDELPSVLAAL